VQRHFADPQAAWDAALALNDGGVSYLTAQLEKVCKPDSKLRQIGAQLGQITADLRQAIAPFHVSDDVEQRISDAQAAATRVIDDLEQALGRHRFGALMAALMVDQDEIEGRISRVPSSVRITSAVSSASAAATTARGPQRPGRPARPRAVTPEDATEEAAETDIRTMTLAQFQAETALEIWIDRLKSLRDDRARRGAYGLGDVTSGDLVAELIHAARRTGLSRKTATQLEEINFGLTVEKQAQPASIMGAEAINGFVSTLGMLDIPEDKRPQVEGEDGSARAVFAHRPGADRVDTLPALPRAMAEAYWTDWVFALDAVFAANARDGAGGEVNIDQNLALGRILGALAGQPAQ